MRLRHLRASKGSKAGIRRAADGGPAIASDVRQKMVFWIDHAGNIMVNNGELPKHMNII
jgi:hypothetical protein